MLNAFIEKTKKNDLNSSSRQYKLLYEWTKTGVVDFKEFTQIANWIAGY